MNFNIHKNRLLPVLTRVSSVVERRQTLPILGNLYFHLADGKLTLVGTDIEMEISETIDDVQGKDCEFTLSSRKISDIVRILPEDSVIMIELERDRAIVSAGRIRYTLNTLDADSFPRMAEGKWEERFKISQRELKTIVDKTAFAMGVQDVRYYLNGLSMEMQGNNVKALAADGHRLAQTSTDVTLASNEERQIIVPRKAVNEIVRFLDGEDESELTVELNNNHLKVTWGKSAQAENPGHPAPVLITKLIDGKVPEYKSVLETELNLVIRVNRARFLETLTRAAVLTTDHEKGVKITVEQNNMRLVTRNNENEESVEELEIDYDGAVFEAGYNISYLIEPARAATTEEIELHFQGNEGICVLKQPGDERSIWLVMPRRL